MKHFSQGADDWIAGTKTEYRHGGLLVEGARWSQHSIAAPSGSDNRRIVLDLEAGVVSEPGLTLRRSKASRASQSISAFTTLLTYSLASVSERGVPGDWMCLRTASPG